MSCVMHPMHALVVLAYSRVGIPTVLFMSSTRVLLQVTCTVLYYVLHLVL